MKCDRCGKEMKRTMVPDGTILTDHDDCPGDAAFNCAVEIGDAFDGVYETDVWHGIVARHIRAYGRKVCSDANAEQSKAVGTLVALGHRIYHTEEHLTALTDAARAVVNVPCHVWKYGALSRGRWKEVQKLLNALAALVKGGEHEEVG